MLELFRRIYAPSAAGAVELAFCYGRNYLFELTDSLSEGHSGTSLWLLKKLLFSMIYALIRLFDL